MPTAPGNRESRAYVRLPVAWKLEVLEWEGEQPVDARPLIVKNGSADGLLLELEHPAQVNNIIVGRLGIADFEVEIYAIVRWASDTPPFRAGVQFFHAAPEHEERLNREFAKLGPQSEPPRN